MILIVMGVSGSGKTTIGQMLADRLGWPFYDGDRCHSPANIDKMSRGLPLTDADRAGWLATLADLICTHLTQNRSAVLACSALKRAYRDQLRVDADAVRFAYLEGDYELIWERMQQRTGHYMKPAMLASQFATLEEPGDAIIVDVRLPPEQIVSQIVRALAGGA